MSQLKSEMKLSKWISLLSEGSEITLNQFIESITKNIGNLLRYLKKQVRFFIFFSYTRDALKKHLLTKAIQFFDQELEDEKDGKTNKNKTKRRSKRENKGGNESEKTKIGWLKKNKYKKNTKKRVENIYKPVE